ncbi:MAG: hypothetical protein DRN17_00035 [Thermoplasmata archaeon]|nr:MAG: hypothetical protein DRN17_00035 [Thermoplasmata archaeon]
MTEKELTNFRELKGYITRVKPNEKVLIVFEERLNYDEMMRIREILEQPIGNYILINTKCKIIVVPDNNEIKPVFKKRRKHERQTKNERPKSSNS